MKTKVLCRSPYNLFSLYCRDRAFIFTQVNLSEDRTAQDKLKIISHMQAIDTYIKVSGFKNKMSFLDYNFIGYLWANILTSWEIDVNKFMMQYNGEQWLELETSAGLIFPHVSRTGLVPIPLINEGWGFHISSTPGINSPVRCIDFLAVGTNKYQSFDTQRKSNSIENWLHDHAHLLIAERIYFFGGNIPSLDVPRKAAYLRKKALEKLPLNSQEHKLFELVCFMLFHENTNDGEKILKKEINVLKKNIRNSYKKFLDPSICAHITLAFSKVFSHPQDKRQYKAKKIEYNKSKDPKILEEVLMKFGKRLSDLNTFHKELAISALEQCLKDRPLRQYRTDIKGALSLGIPISGRTFGEQILNYLVQLEKGLLILKPYAKFYDES